MYTLSMVLPLLDNTKLEEKCISDKVNQDGGGEVQEKKFLYPLSLMSVSVPCVKPDKLKTNISKFSLQ